MDRFEGGFEVATLERVHRAANEGQNGFGRAAL
jgi:hypothetical protein